MEEKYQDWQVPAFESDPGKRAGWVTEAVQEGEQWVRSQHAYKDADENLRLLSCEAGGLKLKTNNLKSDIRKFVETIGNVREIATYGVGAEQLKSYVDMLNRVVKHIYRWSHFARQDRQALQYAVAMGRAYMWLRFIRRDFGWGEGEFEFVPMGLKEVLPVQMPSSNDIQGCYAVTIVECMGVAEAHARFPRYQDVLTPISKSKISSRAQVGRLEFWDRKYGQDGSNWDQRYCEIYHTFVRDLRVNRTGQELEMGDANTSWYYKVPTVGGLKVSLSPETMLPESHEATAEECRVYPQLRQIISNPNVSNPLYDGPAFDWHGMMPPVAYDVDDWPWMAVGFSLLHDVAGIERSERGFLDLMFRVMKAKMKPVMGYDLNSGVSREDIKRMDLLEESERGTNIGVDGEPRKALQSILPDSVQVTDGDFKMVELLEKLRQKALGLNDLASLAQLKFNLSSGTADKILETIGPIAQGIAGNMDLAHSKIAQMLRYMIPQYLTSADVMSYIGPDGITAQVFDFKPNSLVPSHLPDEGGLQEEGHESRASEIERAKYLAKSVKVVSVPSSLMVITHMQEQMKYLNFLQRGLPISFDTAFKKLGVENWGDSPGTTEFEKWKWEQREMAKAKVDTMKTVAGEMPPGAGVPQGKDGKGKGGGRPPSGKIPPKLEAKGDGRTVLSQSK